MPARRSISPREKSGEKRSVGSVTSAPRVHGLQRIEGEGGAEAGVAEVARLANEARALEKPLVKMVHRCNSPCYAGHVPFIEMHEQLSTALA